MSEWLPPSPTHLQAVARADALLALAPALYRTARRLTLRLEDASAITRDTISGALADAGAREPFRTPAFRALWMALEALWRTTGHASRSGPLKPAEQILAQQLALDEGELDRLLMSRLDASPEVDLALRTLPERERFVLLLIDVEGATREEVATALGASAADTVRVLLDARARMCASLVDYVHRSNGGHRTSGRQLGGLGE